MPKYTTSYTRNSLTFTEIERHDNISLFEGVVLNGRIEFEVHILRDKPAHPKSAEAGQMILCSPSSSEWGKNGFTYQSRDKASRKFEALATKTDRNAEIHDSVEA